MGRPQTEETRRKIGQAVSRAAARAPYLVPEKKRCPQCKTYKPIKDFSWANRKMADGSVKLRVLSWCKECTNARRRQQRKEDPEAVRKKEAKRDRSKRRVDDNYMVDGAKLVAWYEALTEYDKASVAEKHKRRIRSIRLGQQRQTSAVMVHEVCDAAGYPEVARTLYE